MQKSIGTTLKNARKNAGMTVEDVRHFLSQDNINSAKKTIYGWENGFSYPSINIFLLLCKYYGIKDILKTFGYDSSIHKQRIIYFQENEYSEEELDDIQKYAEFLKAKRLK